jgi:hypothetical protein
MTESAMKYAVKLATSGDGPLCQVASQAVETRMLVPSILRQALEAAGYQVTYHVNGQSHAPQGPCASGRGAWVKVTMAGGGGRHVVAQAYSEDEPDALLQAVYAAMREEAENQSAVASVLSHIDSQGA